MPEISTEGRVALSRAEVILLLALAVYGVSAWAAAAVFVSAYAKGSEPREEQARLRHEAPRKEAALRMTLDERRATEEHLVRARLEAAQQSAALDALVNSAAPQAARDGPDRAAPASEAARAETSLRRETAARLVESQTRRLALLQDVADRQAAALDAARGAAAREYGRDLLFHRAAESLMTLLAAALLIAAPLALAEGARRRLARRFRAATFGANGRLMFGAAGALLAVLLLQQAFGAAGAAFAGVFLTLLLLTWMSRARGAGGAERAHAAGEGAAGKGGRDDGR